jgi:hypothetical protein
VSPPSRGASDDPAPCPPVKRHVSNQYGRDGTAFRRCPVGVLAEAPDAVTDVSLILFSHEQLVTVTAEDV